MTNDKAQDRRAQQDADARLDDAVDSSSDWLAVLKVLDRISRDIDRLKRDVEANYRAADRKVKAMGGEGK